jgi:hypothetical protein
MNELAFLGEWLWKESQHDLESLALRMSSLIIGKLAEGSPDRALEILADPAHPEHDERREWIGRPCDPEAFDPSEVEDNLRNGRLDVRRRGVGGRSGREGADRDDGDAVGADVAEACPRDDSEN